MKVNIAIADGTMGVVTTVAIDPTRISPRVKKKLIRFLQQGLLEGGYRSDARKLGELMIEAFDLNISSNTWCGIHVVNASSELKKELLTLRQADWSAYIMENPERGRQTGWDYRRMRDDIAQLESSSSPSSFLHFADHQYRRLASTVIAQHLPPEFKASVQKAIDALNGTALIPVRGA
jgi:hypothetical protein